jgi:hypothetical protein
MEELVAGHRRRLNLFDLPVVFLAEDAVLLATACAPYAHWPAGTPLSEPAIEIRLELGAAPDAEADIRVEGRRLAITGAGIRGEADADMRRARCTAPRRLLGDPAAMAAEVTDTLLLFLLARCGRTPVHAAGVLLGDTTLLLAGPSGSGKSTLALAAMRRGLPILSDDTLYIQLRPSLRIWGVPRPLHVFPEDAPRFTSGRRLRGGKLKAIVPLAAGAAGGFADKARLILLERGERLALERLDAEAARAGLSRLDPGFDLLPEESAQAARALAAGGGWRLTLARDPDAAVDFLCERLLADARAP